MFTSTRLPLIQLTFSVPYCQMRGLYRFARASVVPQYASHSG